MIDLDALRDFGADVDDGLTRCMNNGDFYLKLVNMTLSEDKLDVIEENINKGDLSAAFSAAHAMKGVFGNLALTPIYTPVSEITERLRANESDGYSKLLNEAKLQMDKLRELINS